VAFIVLAIAGWSAPAAAQGWLSDRSRAEGPGFRVGDLELHPGVGAEIGWDSNIYYTQDNPVPGLPGIVDSGILRITPHLLMSTVSGQRLNAGEGAAAELPPEVQFRGGLSASYYEYFADERRRNVSVDADLALKFFEGRVVSFGLHNVFARSIRPFTENTTFVSTARIRETVGLDVKFSTSGDVLQIGVGYDFGLDFFEGDQFGYANSFNHTISLTESFRFLPRTALVHQTQAIFRDYYQPPPSADGARPSLTDHLRLQSMVGINGALTNEFSLTAMVGYGAGFYQAIGAYDQDADSFLAQAQVRWMPMDRVQFALGYDRSFQSSFLGNYYTQDRGFLNGQMNFGGAFLLGFEFSAGYLDYGQIVAADGRTPIGQVKGVPTTERTDVRLMGQLFAEYRFVEWLAMNGSFQYTGNVTDFSYLTPTSLGAAVVDPAAYNKFELWLGVRVFY
jgi:hypothetical protein